MDKQFCSLKIDEKCLENYLVESGYWASDYLRRRNQYVLSPCAYQVSIKQQKQLSILGREIYSALEGVAIMIHEIAICNPRNRFEQGLMSVATKGSKKLLSPLETKDGLIPPVIKVDMVQGEDGGYHAVEVDAYNPRGLGFNALFDNQVRSFGAKFFNTTKNLSEMILEHFSEGEFVFIVSEYERYYEPSFKVLQKDLIRFGVKMNIIREKDYSSANNSFDLMIKNSKGCIFMIPESLQNVDFKKALLEGYKKGDLKFFFPPKAYLGSKMLLPYIQNQSRVNGCIPLTRPVYKGENFKSLLGLKLVLKEAQSSGTKGISFSTLDKEEFKKRFKEESKKKRPSCIVQEIIDQKNFRLKIFENEKIVEKNYYLRIIAQFTSKGVIGLDVTGRPDPMVHGSPDCIMLPVVLA